MDPTVIESPCTLVCSIDLQSGFCFGCGRTGDEIASWIAYTPEKRQAVMAELPARMVGLEHVPRRKTKRSLLARLRGEST